MASLCINLKELLYAGYGTVEMQDSVSAADLHIFEHVEY